MKITVKFALLALAAVSLACEKEKEDPQEQPVFGHLTDDEHLYTEVPLFPGEEEGTVVIELKNNAVALLEL